jgi:ribosomal protein S18 acetylase RimI-like enzyme
MNKKLQKSLFIRDFKIDDYNDIIELWNSLGLSNPKRGDDKQVILKTIEHGGKLMLLIDELKHKIIGTSWITTDYRRLYLHHFGIAQEYQGLGLSHLLLAESLNFAKEMNMQIKLEVNRKNFRAINLYKKAGFQYLGDYDVYIIRGVQSIDYNIDIF